MIYFIQAGENGPIKIGESENPKERLNQLQTANPYKLELLWVFNDGDSEWNEAKVQAIFDHELIKGEWFRPSRELLKFIRNEMNNHYFVKFLNTNSLYEIIEIYPKGEIVIGCGLRIERKNNDIKIAKNDSNDIKVELV